jgi:hypothetical protein
MVVQGSGPEEPQRYREVRRPPWSPAQIVALLAGLLLVVIGGVGLARSGLDFSNIPLTHTQVAGLPYSCLSALVQLVAGVVLLGGAAHPDTARSVMIGFGVLLVAFGLIVAIEPAPFSNIWGFDSTNGVFYTVVGAILMVAAAVSPVFVSRQRAADNPYRDGPRQPPGTGRGRY